MNTFVRRHRESVIGVLNGFDRVRIRGTLRWLCYPDGLAKHLTKMRVLLKDFKGDRYLYGTGILGKVGPVAASAYSDD